ncbi:PhnE/PtxC family ABC transporter permease [Leptolyngbya sp. PCC 6406]|uniref:PhnE/PtxC family ABC transporter permease n=1 Tax=Leptolyngbya sp. PCC 6406 TaxID=1173264 RepID=UPI0002ABB4A5|nr:ABC transporter permease subunit [Leptolyngbya sp. PCC 6406]
MGAIAASLYGAGVGRQEVINWGGLPLIATFFRASLTPDLGRDFLQIILRATGVTFAYGVCGTVLSLLLGFIGGIAASEMWWRTLWPRRPWLGRPLWVMVRGLLAVPRAIHELIWGLIFVNLIGLDPLVAVIAIAVPFGAIVAKVFSEILDETPSEPLQALVGAGVPPLMAFLYGLLPQALPNLISYSFYRFECALRSAAVLGIIGAGGLGYEIFLSLQSLRYEQLWTAFYALILLNGAVDAWSGWVRRQMGFTSRLDINAGGAPSQGSRSPTAMARYLMPLSLVAGAIAIPLCFASLDLGWQSLWAAPTWARLGELVQSSRPKPLTGEQIGTLASLAGQTVAMAILAITLAGIGGIIAAFPAAQNIWMPGGLLRPIGQRLEANDRTGNRGWGAGLALVLSRLLLLVSRAVPAPIWALVCLYGLFPGLLPGAIALALHNFGILGRLMAEVNENLDDRPVRALRALGSPSSLVLLYGLLPQTLGRFLAYILYRWEVCMRETVIVGLVGAGGLGRLMTEQISSFDYQGLTVTLGVFVVLTFGVDLISTRLRSVLH